MRVEARRRLLKDIDAVSAVEIKRRVAEFAEDAAQCTLAELMRRYDFGPLKDNSAFYRLRIDRYRLGCRYDRAGETLILMRLLHRGEIYRYFP